MAAGGLAAAEQVLSKAAFGALLCGTGLSWGRAAFSRGRGLQGPLRRPEAVAMVAAAGSLAGLLTLRWVESGHFPLSNLYESLIFLGFGITSVHVYLSGRERVAVVGAVTAPAALSAVAGAALLLPPELQRASALVPALQSNWLMMHVSVMIMSYAALMVGSLLAGTALLAPAPAPAPAPGGDREALGGAGQLPQGGGAAGVTGGASFGRSSAEAELAPVSGGPPVLELQERLGEALQERLGDTGELRDTCDDLGYRTLGLGFALLTLGLISGAVWANEAWGAYWSWDPKETWALITWLVYAIYLHTRLSDEYSQRDSNLVAVVGFAVTWVCYLGVNLFGVGLHSYGFLSS